MNEQLAVQEAGSVEETRERMQVRLSGIVPEFEIAAKAELAFKVNQLKRERNAVILGHNYMEPALYHSVPDHVGDSLGLSRVSARTDADIIVFCGVSFMAETAKVLNPDKIVLCPVEKAGCSLADGITPSNVAQLKQDYPDAVVVTYVNTSAEVKAVSDYCCTSGNAKGVVKHLLEAGHEQILFLPDEYLARNTADEMGIAYVHGADGERPKPGEPTLIGWGAHCEVHELFTVEDVQAVRDQFPDAVILAHPECSPAVIALADISGSTAAMVNYVRDVDAPHYLLLTECSMGDNLAAEFPERDILRLCSLQCQYMNLITLEDTLDSLEKLQYRIELPAEIIERARVPIDRMLAIT